MYLYLLELEVYNYFYCIFIIFIIIIYFYYIYAEPALSLLPLWVVWGYVLGQQNMSLPGIKIKQKNKKTNK